MLIIAGLLGGCIDRAAEETSEDEIEQTPVNVADVSEDAPEPIDVDPEDLEMVDLWSELGVPTYRGSDVLDFDPHPTSVPNGGTILLDGFDSPPEEIIAFYRGALRTTGWEERRVRAHEITARNDNASLLVTITVHDTRSLIMMMLTDAPN